MDMSVYQHCYFLSSSCAHRHTPDSQCTLKYLSLAGAVLKGKKSNFVATVQLLL